MHVLSRQLLELVLPFNTILTIARKSFNSNDVLDMNGLDNYDLQRVLKACPGGSTKELILTHRRVFRV